MDFYQNASEVYKGLKPRVDQLKSALNQRRVYLASNMAHMEELKRNLEEDALVSFKPSSTLPNSAPQGFSPAPSRSPLAGNKITKSGHLFKRNVPKSPVLNPYWVRRWCSIKNGCFSYQNVGKQRVNPYCL